jgi:hypothetical protein
MVLPLIFKLTFINFATLTSANTLYEIRDLEVLEREKNFDEFIQHVNDIRPSERDSHWKEMYQNVSMGLIDKKVKVRDYTNESFEKIEKMAQSSALYKDEFFQAKRAIYAKKYFINCFKNSQTPSEKSLCENKLTSFWNISNKDPDLGLELANILETNSSSMKNWSLYEKAVKDENAQIYCQKPNVQQAIFEKIKSSAFSENFSGNYKQLVDIIVPNWCFNNLVNPLKESILSTESNGIDKELAINILDAKEKLSQQEEELYSFLYLIDGPVVGKRMNIAWKKVEGLSESQRKRDELIKQIKSVPILPDRIFNTPDLPRNKAIINLFAKNFPEFLKFYGESCLKYLHFSGQDSINVSSRSHCEEFLKTAKAQNSNQVIPWISDSISRQYSAIKR